MASGDAFVSDELGQVVGKCWHCLCGRRGLSQGWACPAVLASKRTGISLGGSRGCESFLGRAGATFLLPLPASGRRDPCFCTSWLGGPTQGASPL